jgi:EAL domain-containing protein (putative c-di-GMP-specific phosphodiesterase class I)
VKISLDDFGTSHACLANVTRLPITAVKIDKMFVRNVVDDRTDAAIIRSILSFAQNLELTTIAEGVETAGQLQWLRDAGCNCAQGYYFAKALPADEFTIRIAGNRSSSEARSA